MTHTCVNCERPLPNGETVCAVCCPPSARPVPDPASVAEIERQLRRGAAGALLGAAFKHPFAPGALEEAERLYEVGGVNDPGLKRRIERAKVLRGFFAFLAFLLFAAVIFNMFSTAR